MSTNISARIVKDSRTRAGSRITTMSLIYPRFIHAEAKTHRALSIDGLQVESMTDVSLMNERGLSRNAMSSRAVPVAKMIHQVRTDPAMPIHWGANQPGMQANGQVEDIELARKSWLAAANVAANIAEDMVAQGLHKQVVNRILEPFQWMHTIVTATDWDNFYDLRIHDAAEPNMRALAECMKHAMDISKPVESDVHIPFFDDTEYLKVRDVMQAAMVGAARCARVSYLNHDGSDPIILKDLDLAEQLRVSKHASPFEHVAFAAGADVRSRNLTGWTQFREVIGL